MLREAAGLPGIHYSFSCKPSGQNYSAGHKMSLPYEKQKPKQHIRTPDLGFIFPFYCFQSISSLQGTAACMLKCTQFEFLQWGRWNREGNHNPVQYSCLGNLMNRGHWWASVHGVAGVRHDLATKPPPPGVGHPTQVYEHVPVRLISSLSLFPPPSLLSSNPRSNQGPNLSPSFSDMELPWEPGPPWLLFTKQMIFTNNDKEKKVTLDSIPFY